MLRNLEEIAYTCCNGKLQYGDLNADFIQKNYIFLEEERLMVRLHTIGNSMVEIICIQN